MFGLQLPGLCGNWDFFAGDKSTTVVLPASVNISTDTAPYEWFVFETGAGTKEQQGAVLGVTFEVKYRDLARVRVECDLNELRLTEDQPRLYRHVFTEAGCDDAKYHASLQFTNEQGGVFSSPMVCQPHVHRTTTSNVFYVCVSSRRRLPLQLRRSFVSRWREPWAASVCGCSSGGHGQWTCDSMN